jgi:hypothetical protein
MNSKKLQLKLEQIPPLSLADGSNANKAEINDTAQNDEKVKAKNSPENVNAINNGNVATENKSLEHKHTPPPECHGERKEVDPAAAEAYKAAKHTRPKRAKEEVQTTTAAPASTTPAPTTTTLAPTKPKTAQSTSTGSTKKATKRHGIKFDANGDSIWEDDSNDSPDSDEGKLEGAKLDADGNMIDTENQASGDREESEEESEESDGIPLITIPLVDILNKYARMMGGKRASNSRYEYSYEDENELKIREIKDRILDEQDNDDDGDEENDKGAEDL